MSCNQDKIEDAEELGTRAGYVGNGNGARFAGSYSNDCASLSTGEEEECETDYLAIIQGEDMFLTGETLSPKLLEFSAERSTAVTSLEYRMEISSFLESGIRTHVVEHKSWGLENRWITLVVLEFEIGEYLMSKNAFRVPIHEALDFIARSCQDSVVCDYLKQFFAIGVGALPCKVALPWKQLGFYKKLLPWTERLLQRESLNEITGIQQIRFSSRSAVYRVSTDKEEFYLKVIRPGSQEIRATLVMNRLFPFSSVYPVACSEDEGFLITENLGITVSKECLNKAKAANEPYAVPKSVAVGLLKKWASFQKGSVAQLDELKFVGVPTYDAEAIRKGWIKLEAFIKEHEIFSSKEHDDFQEQKYILDMAFELWERSRIPYTVVHGDLSESNVAQPRRPEGEFVFFDWDSLYIGHPFLDLLETEWDPLYEHVEAYLECWSSYCEMSKIREVAAITMPVQSILNAVKVMEDSSYPFEEMKRLVAVSGREFLERAGDLKQKGESNNAHRRLQ